MNYTFSCNKDREEFLKILNYNLQLLCGNYNEKEEKNRNSLNSALESVKIIPNLPDEYLDQKRLSGETIFKSTGKSSIYMKGFNYAPLFKYNHIKHIFSHEIWHAICAIMNRKNDKTDKNGKRIYKKTIVNGKKYIGAGGLIVDTTNGKGIGKLFQETMMDICASITLFEFDREYKLQNPNVNADTIISEHIDKWNNNNMSGYSVLTSITRLMIAACSNEPNLNYHYWIQQGEPFAELKTRRNNGNIMNANDFLYGMMYDPIYIMEEYDKYMGEGSYLELLKITDQIYEQGISPNEDIDSNLVKQVMTEISGFANVRTHQLKQQGVFSDKDILVLSSHYNRIWNSMQKEYSAYFSRNDINNIRKK